MNNLSEEFVAYTKKIDNILGNVLEFSDKGKAVEWVHAWLRCECLISTMSLDDYHALDLYIDHEAKGVIS